MSEKVLIVDDEPGMRSLLVRVMEKQGYHARAASAGAEAMEMMAREEWHLVVADIDMPEMNGLELLEKIRSRSPGLPVVMITAYATVESAVEAMKLGAYDYITKPFQTDEIRLVVQKALSASASSAKGICCSRRSGDATIWPASWASPRPCARWWNWPAAWPRPGRPS